MPITEEKKQLNPEQLLAVSHKNGPMLVLAGAGSGKTKVATMRIAEMIETGVLPDSILGVTFTNKAAQEMKERVEHYVGQSVFIATFHALGAKMLRESIHYLGYSNDFVIYDEMDADKLLKECVKELGIDKSVEIKELRYQLSEAKNQLQEPSRSDRLLHEVFSLYQKKLKNCNAVDFDDLLFLPVKLLQEHPDIKALYQERYQYILVDEYQDTNHAQYVFVRLLAGDRCNLFVVGDPDQSIYSWRGANIENILNFEKDFPGAQVIRLEQNYRSTSTILDAANAVIKNNASRYEKSLWSAAGDGEKIWLHVADTERREADFVVREIDTLLDSGVSEDDIAIFYRTNFQSRIFEDLFIAKKIPYTIVGGLSFYQRKEVKDILSFLRLIDNPKDRMSFARVINLPKRGIGDQTLVKFFAAQDALGEPVLDFLCRLYRDDSFDTLGFSVGARQKKGFCDFAEKMIKLREQKDDLGALVEMAINDTGYLDVLESDPESFQERMENVEELLAKASQWQIEQEDPTLSKFLEELALVSSHDASKKTGPSVSLMTLHNGKGLEFSYAFLVGLEEFLFPHINSKNEEDKVEEERRLFYVGITRAKKRLTISCAKRRMVWGSVRSMHPSRFLREIPMALFQKVASSNITYIPKEEVVEKSPVTDLVVGDVVLHKDFGIGKVERLYEGSLGAMVDVTFTKEKGTKKLALQYAPLHKLHSCLK